MNDLLRIASFAIAVSSTNLAVAEPKPAPPKVHGMGGAAARLHRPPEFFAYVAAVQKAIRGNWRYKGENEKLICRVTFDLSPKGNVSNLSLTQGSGDLAYDQSVLEAIDASNPLPPPPEELYDSFKTVRMAFSPLAFQ